MTTFSLIVAFTTMLIQVLGRLYCLGWRDQKPEGRVADAILAGVYGVAAYGLWGLF